MNKDEDDPSGAGEVVQRLKGSEASADGGFHQDPRHHAESVGEEYRPVDPVPLRPRGLQT